MQDYRYLRLMTDETGILQFSRLDEPDQNSGYTLDDNARALMVAALNDFAYDQVLQYALFLHSAQQQDGSWSNFYHNKTYSSRFDSEDSIGRALLACAAGTFSKWDTISQLCEEMFIKNIEKTLTFHSPRAIAYTLLGLCKISSSETNKNKYALFIDRLFDELLGLYETYHGPRWYWFENYLTYCNGILPQAILAVYNLTGSKKALKIGRDSLDFLCGILFRYGYLNIIGNQGWYQRGEKIAMFDQQPVDAASVVTALNEGYTSMGRREYLEMSQKGYLWYLGENIHSLSLYNTQTGGCFDALTPQGVNGNQGAEAVLSLLLTEFVISQQQLLNREISI